MKKNSLKITFILLVAGLLMIISQGISWSISAAAADQTFNHTKQKIAEPTIMVPGTNGDVSRFDGLINQLESANSDTKVLKVTVDTDGTLHTQGSINSNTQHPVIVIAFEDASDGQTAVAKQAVWYQKALEYLHNIYDFDQYNVIGHSNGGLVLTDYLENDKRTEDPSIDHLITLGTPYNDVSSAYNDKETFKATSPWLASYIENKDNLPTELKVINIAGNPHGTGSDGTVDLASVLSGEQLYQDAASYTELQVNASHSDLVEAPAVVKTIENIIG